MNRAEAKRALTQGKVLTHTSFTDEEYIYRDKRQNLRCESGNKLDEKFFWKDRAGERWNKGWSEKTVLPVKRLYIQDLVKEHETGEFDLLPTNSTIVFQTEKGQEYRIKFNDKGINVQATDQISVIPRASNSIEIITNK